MSTLWHSKYLYVINVRLACKVCVQELLHSHFNSSWNTPAHIFDNKSRNSKGKKSCLYFRVLEFHPCCQLKGFLIEAKWWRCQRPSRWPETPYSPLTQNPRTPPQLQSATPTPKPDMDGDHHSSVTPDCVPAALLRFFLDITVKTTQKKWLLSTSWLMIKRNMVYFPMAP